MEQGLYDRPEVYDALYTGKEYKSEVAFVVDRFEQHGNAEGSRALVVGCGTGEHSRHLVSTGFSVVCVDPNPAMLARAHEKSDSRFCVGALPDLPISGKFDLVWVPFTVLNYLTPDELRPALESLASVTAEDGLLVCDTGDFPDMTGTQLETAGEYARIFQFRRSGHRVRMDAVIFDGESWVTDRHTLTQFSDEEIEEELRKQKFIVERHGWYTERTMMADPSVFVARR